MEFTPEALMLRQNGADMRPSRSPACHRPRRSDRRLRRYQPSAPIFPAGPKDFFYKVVDAQITFTADGLVLHQNGGDMPAQRIPTVPSAPK